MLHLKDLRQEWADPTGLGSPLRDSAKKEKRELISRTPCVVFYKVKYSTG
jgi:hypothetical protein